MSDEKTRGEGIRKMLDGLPTKSRISVFNHERSFGVLIGFCETGFGFGEITLLVDKATGEARCDLEAMSPERCGELMMRAVGVPVGDVAADYAEEEKAFEAERAKSVSQISVLRSNDLQDTSTKDK